MVVTPPRQWNPAPGLASALLTETDSAPWLQPASLSSLLAKHSTKGQVPRKQPPPQEYGHGELHKSLLRKVRDLEAAIRLQADVLGEPPAKYLSGAVAAIESSAWRGDPAQAKHLLAWVSGFVAARSHLVHIIQGGGQVTLTGKSGPVPVSIVNRMGQPVTVRLLVQAPVQPADHPVQVGPDHHRQVPAEDRGGEGALVGRGLDHAQAEPARHRTGPRCPGPGPRSRWTRRTSAPRHW